MQSIISLLLAGSLAFPTGAQAQSDAMKGMDMMQKDTKAKKGSPSKGQPQSA